MRLRTPLRAISAGALVLALGVALSIGAGASTPRTFEWQQWRSAILVETDATAANSVLSYQRSSDGTISFADSYATGDVGATATNATANPLASQGGLTLANNGADLIATNAGSNTVRVFAVDGTDLRLLQQIPSGGLFSDFVATSGRYIAVLNAGGADSVSEFQWLGGLLPPLDRCGALRFPTRRPWLSPRCGPG